MPRLPRWMRACTAATPASTSQSLHGTLNHLLVADRIWMHRLQGTGEQPRALNEILFEDLASLSAARAAEDERILGFAAALRRRHWMRCGSTVRSTARPSASRSGRSSRTCSTTRPTIAVRRMRRSRAWVSPSLPPLDLLIMQRERAGP